MADPAAAPRRAPQFNGYRVLDELPRGGSGAYLYLAEPRSEHKRSMRERGVELPDRVVIKSFSVQSGAHVSGILREGRALDAAKRLGQVLEHEASGDGLYYVMPFVPGVTLDEFMERLRSASRSARRPCAFEGRSAARAGADPRPDPRTRAVPRPRFVAQGHQTRQPDRRRQPHAWWTWVCSRRSRRR
ncbi:MAG: hypothetical protein R3F17_15295 [Planctomycetota bacterium]